MTLDDYLAAVAAEQRDDRRRGQTAFNVLAAHRPDLARLIQTTGLDPYYDDTRLPAFHQWVREQWDQKP